MRARWMCVMVLPLLWFGAAVGGADWTGAVASVGVLILLIVAGFVDKVLWP